MVEDHGYDKRLASALQLTTLLLFLCFLVFFARWYGEVVIVQDPGRLGL